MLAETESRIIPPAETQSVQQTILDYDNIDNLEETFSGYGTSHEVNGITIQKALIGPLPKANRVKIEKSKR